MLTRRTHASYYVDIDKRIAEASVAMYGPNINNSIAILKEYNVKYLYLDQYIFQNPTRVRPEFKTYLQNNNVQFVETIDRYDIAQPMDRANTMPLLIIPPQNITVGFMNLWTKVYDVQVGGQIVGQLYKLKE